LRVGLRGRSDRSHAGSDPSRNDGPFHKLALSTRMNAGSSPRLQ
jgi:hypothetical protein